MKSRNNIRSPVLLLLLMFCFSSALIAQDLTVQGTVKSAVTRETLPGVTVICDSVAMAQTDSAGRFSMQLPAGKHILAFRLLGFREQRVDIVAKQDFNPLTVFLADETTELGTVVVTAGRHEQKIEEVTVSMEVIRPSLVENTNATSMESVIDQVPGVNVIDGQANIRGGAGWSYGAGSRVLVLVDDMPQISADAGDAKWGFIPTENLEQVEVIKGASSALFGSSALNGVINFRTASPGVKPLTKVGIYSGMYDNPVLDLGDKSYDLKWWDGTQFISGMNFLHSRQLGEVDLVVGGNALIDDGYRQGEFEHRYRFNTNIRWRTPTKGLSVGVNLNMQTASGALFFIWKDDTTGAYIPYDNTLSDYTNNKYSIDPYFIYFNKKGNSHKLRSRYFNNTNTNNTSQNSTSEVYFGEYQYQHKSRSEKMTLTAGAVSQYSRVTSQLYHNHTGSNYAAYIQAEARTGSFGFSAGVRAEQNAIDDFTDDPVVVFRAGVNWQAMKATWLRASAGQGYRFPTIAERYVSTTIGLIGIYPNNNLQPEDGFSSELGIRQAFTISHWKGYADLAGFLNRYNNMMEFAFALWGQPTDPLGGYGFSSINVGNTEIKGVELSVGGTGLLGKNVKLDLMAGYTYMDPRQISYNQAYIDKVGESESMGSDSSDFLKYRYRHLARLDAEVTWKKISVGASGRYNSFMVNIDKIFTYDFAPPTGVAHYRQFRQQGDLVIDARIGCQFNAQWKAAFICKNVLNYIFMQRPGDMQPPRTYVLQVNLTI